MRQILTFWNEAWTHSQPDTITYIPPHLSCSQFYKKDSILEVGGMENGIHFLTKQWHTRWLWSQVGFCKTTQPTTQQPWGNAMHYLSKSEVPRNSWVISDKLLSLSEVNSFSKTHDNYQDSRNFWLDENVKGLLLISKILAVMKISNVLKN